VHPSLPRCCFATSTTTIAAAAAILTCAKKRSQLAGKTMNLQGSWMLDVFKT
jgi:hypothetical protein